VALTVEPVMHVVIVVAQEFAACLHALVPRHRGRLDSSEHRDGVQTIRARVPQAEVAAFVSAVLADTNGRARTSMVLDEYWPVLERPPGEPTAGVREPRPNVPVLRSGAIAVPEPEPDDDSDRK
jgi:translation elongation factor EF-G